MSNTYNGKLVAAEGIDHSGKTTVIENLQHELGNNWHYTKEPSDGKYGQYVRETLSDNHNPSPADFYLFLADRYEHCNNVIRPTLEHGTNILCDRYHLSTFAYQSRVLDEQLKIIDPFKYIEEMTGHFVIEPDLTIYVDIPVDVALQRMDDDAEKYEKKERLTEAKRVYDYFADAKDHVVRVDGTMSEENVLGAAMHHVKFSI